MTQDDVASRAPQARWDLIVVGAGSAGAALAARCAARGRRVLLVEAGKDYRSAEMDEIWRSPNPVQALVHPDRYGELLWTDLLATRTDAQAPHLYWRGRGVGGSSAINGQIAIRPPRDDFDDWAAAGCSGWSWDEALPYFCRIEDDVDFGDRPYHGKGGPIPVYRMARDEWGSVDQALAGGAADAGFPWAEDVNAPGAAGVSPYPINSRDHRRVTTNDAYLEPARGLATLTIAAGALVDRVLIEGGRAVGVEIIEGGGRRREYAEETVLCAGAIHSPCILMRSGIGPAQQLRRFGIDVVTDLPVGQTLQDHALCFLMLKLRPESSIQTPDDRHTNCCVRYRSDDPDSVPHDMMIVAMNQSSLAMESAELDPSFGAIGAWVNRVYSHGTVELASSDPTVQPIVAERMLSDERDLRRLRQSVRMLADIVRSQPVSQICAESPDRTNPELWRALADADRALDDHLMAVTTDAQHGTSTCPMGPADQPGSVVDPDCRVLGIDALRVVDASIFPFCPRANTHLATVVVGEVMADRLLDGR
jgi:choline dehydrogenase